MKKVLLIMLLMGGAIVFGVLEKWEQRILKVLVVFVKVEG